MKPLSFLAIPGGLLLSGTALLHAAEPSGPAFYGDPPDQRHPWAIHDRNRPQPPQVTPGTFGSQAQPGKPPSDAIVLFDGSDLSQWMPVREPKDPSKKWALQDGAMQAVPGAGDIRTREEFGDCQLHIEWSAPTEVKGDSQGRGNSGVFLMGMAEVQVLDNYDNPTYADGFAGSVYGINPPLVNALRPPGEFQVYDIVFRRPLHDDAGKEIDPGYVTVFCNGVLVQDHTRFEGPGGHRGRSSSRPFPEKGPIKLQDHGNPVRFRNIWLRPLPPRALEGGTIGALSRESAVAQRAQTAAQIREDAATMDADQPGRMLRLMESLVYQQDDAASAEAGKLATAYAKKVDGYSAEEMEARKGEIMRVKSAFDYVVKFDFVPAPFAPKTSIDKSIDEAGWNEKK